MKDMTGHMPKLVNDYRTLLNDKSIDVFMVATPDHWHAMLTIEGCLAGTDVYVEKPASHNILEGKTAVAAKKLLEDALILQESGAFSVVLEAVPEQLAEWIIWKLSHSSLHLV